MKAGAANEDRDIIVTGSRLAEQEDLGDLKLYRVPTAPRSQAVSRNRFA